MSIAISASSRRKTTPGDDAEDVLVVVDDGKPLDAVRPHQARRGPQGRVRRDRHDRSGQHVRGDQSGRLRPIAPPPRALEPVRLAELGDLLHEEVRLGDDADQHTVFVDDREGADPVLEHPAHDLLERRERVHGHDRPGHHVRDRLHRSHLLAAGTLPVTQPP
jgi:hypothetical protein